MPDKAATPALPMHGRRRGRALLCALFAALLACALTAGHADAQQLLAFPKTPPKEKRAMVPSRDGKDQMLVQAERMDYDYNNQRVAAVGNVQIHYRGASLEANRVIYDQKTKRLHAEGNVRLTDEDGSVTYGEVMDLSDDYRDGFVDSLHVDTADRTRMAAARANRSGGNFTVFESGVYTACLPCKDDPKKPPLWQVKAARVIHDKNEKMIYFEDAQLEFFGVPSAFLPYFSTPDPTVKRKSGFLMPYFQSSNLYGVGAGIPYYWALAPNYDATFAPLITTKQGPLLQGEFRHRLTDGYYAIRAAGIHQLDPNTFAPGAPGNRENRGSIESHGQFALNDRWVWGWSGILMSDRSFIQDYRPRLSAYQAGYNAEAERVGGLATAEAVSNAYISGKGSRSYFDARSIYYYGFSNADQQNQIPVIHPVIDYDYTFDRTVLGGEVSLKTNFVSLSRNTAEYNAVTQLAQMSGNCQQTLDPARNNPANCLLRGIPGNYNRFSTLGQWRTTYTDSLGQQFTPFASVRVDAATLSIKNDPVIPSYLPNGNSDLARVMPTVGVEYRYPLINVQPWGTQIIEPIAQIVVRPNEMQIGRWPNEDAQSLIFDDTNLFKTDKFSGWDRVEGGGRANVGAQYTLQLNEYGTFNALFGQSFQLFGTNSFAGQGPARTGADSGLDTNRSDYVSRFSYAPNRSLTFTSRFRFDKDTFETKRTEIGSNVNFDRWNFGVLYGNYAPQSNLGVFARREGITGSAGYSLNANWKVFGSTTYDLDAHRIFGSSIGIGYIDDCFILALNYARSYSYDTNGLNPRKVDTIMLQWSLRTLGGSTISRSSDADLAGRSATSY